MKQVKVQESLEKILRENPTARSLNANQLYKLFIKTFYPNEDFEKIYDNFELYGMPAIESVPRARRDLVEKYPELAGSETAENARWEKEKEMHNFYGRRSFWKENMKHIPIID